ncbi:MAG: indole-3-glycerol phosphate synthase TrpC [Candidatus Omnitrophota bacterium]|jgi:indole-3-glycerol phosphate synthase|nr:indole-3-glycerol phosphate synthase TrpC [Candidatus Omnitrophota bacterium]
MKNFLREIVKIKKKEVDALKIKTPITHFVNAKRLLKGQRAFKDAISTNNRVNLIAEIKWKSPSKKKGFRKKHDASLLAGIYAQRGAKAISIVTDHKFFGGKLEHIKEVRKYVNLPVLRKDFIIDEYQVYQSRYAGADAILLIARILSVEQMKSFIHLANRIGMACVVEIHNEADLDKAIASEAKIVGINNRDLDTFKVDLAATFKLAQRLPKGIVKISESGIKTNEDIKKLKKLGVNAVLIGESFLEAKDIGLKVQEIMGDK